jgi:hypothetical protein
MLGHHYWNGEDEEVKREIISEKKYLPLQDFRDHTTCFVIKSLLDKDASHRMKLDGFMVVTNLTSRFILFSLIRLRNSILK